MIVGKATEFHENHSHEVPVLANPGSITPGCQTHAQTPPSSLGLALEGAAGAQALISTSELLTCLQKLPTRFLGLLLLQDSSSIWGDKG